MTKYTYKDVIINPEDPRVEIGAECYFGDNPGEVLKWANGAGVAKAIDRINRGNFPFSHDGVSFPCIIRKKDTEKYVPFDLSHEKDRARLRDAWIRPKGRLSVGLKIIAMDIDCVFFHGEKGQTTGDLLMEYEFIDGSPCGKIEEVE